MDRANSSRTWGTFSVPSGSARKILQSGRGRADGALRWSQRRATACRRRCRGTEFRAQWRRARQVCDACVVQALGRGEGDRRPQHDALGARDGLGAIGNLRLCAEMVQGFEHGGEVAGLVVDDGDTHQSRPFVDGSIAPSCLSREQATRRARAKALKMASILW